LDGRASHLGATPVVSLPYIAGFIGWSVPICEQSKTGRCRPESKEVIIDVPLALKCGFRLALPVGCAQFLSGDLMPKTKKSHFHTLVQRLFIIVF